jgi:hypothetical protein
MTADEPIPSRQRAPWNKVHMTGQKRPLKPKDVWTIRVRLQLEGNAAGDHSAAAPPARHGTFFRTFDPALRQRAPKPSYDG